MSDARWYDPDTLDIVEQVEGSKKDTMVKCDIRHARKYGFLPSVTTIIKEVLASGKNLQDWIVEQNIKACVSFPFDQNPDDDEALSKYMAMIKIKASEYAMQAADEGSRLHGCVNRWFKNGTMPDDPVALRMINQIDNRLKELSEQHGVVIKITSEEAVGSKAHGFCGTPDAMVVFEDGFKIIADIKTTSMKSYKKPYDSWRSQLGAYSILTNSDPSTALEQWVFDRGDGQGVFEEHEEPEKWRQHFQNLRDCYFIQKNFDPREL